MSQTGIGGSPLVSRSDQLQDDMHDPGFRLFAEARSTFIEDPEHRDVLREDLRNKFLEPSLAGNCGKMLHHQTNTLALTLVDNHEGHLGRARLQYDVTTAADDQGIRPPSSSTATRGTWLTKSTFRKKSISFSVKLRLAPKKRR